MTGYVLLSIAALLLIGCVVTMRKDKKARREWDNDLVARQLRLYSDEYNEGR